MYSALKVEELEKRQLLSTTNILADFGGVYPTQSVNINGISYFAANDGIHGEELWKSDGTIAGTVMVKDITPGVGSTEFDGLFAVGDHVLFVIQDGKNSLALWSSDGTSDGTIRLCHAGVQTGATSAVVLGNELVFNVPTGAMNECESSLWISDGTAAGTKQIYDFPANSTTNNNFNLYSVGSHVVLTAPGAFWTTDGTTIGTIDLTNLPGQLPDHGLSQLSAVGFPVIYNNLMYFANADAEVWSSDGTAAGTHLIRPGIGDMKITGISQVGGKIYFSNDADGSGELWTTDGTEQGTVRLAQFAAIESISDSGVIGNDLVFGTRNNDTTSGLWISDGTVQGTKELYSVTGDSYTMPSDFRTVEGIVFFAGYDVEHGQELWRTDGTANGTSMVQDIAPGPNSTDGATFASMAVVDEKLLIRVNGEPLLFDPTSMMSGLGPTEQYIKMSGSVLRIFGTQGNDSIHLYDVTDDPDRFIVEINGSKQSFAFADVSRIYVYSYSGNDTIEVSQKLAPFTARCAIWAGDGNDTVETGNGRDTIYGEGGDDYVFGGNNNDMLCGGTGNDTLIAGNGNDTVAGDDGADSIQGNKGNDILSGGDDNSKDTVDGGEGGNVLFGQAVYDVFFNGNSAGNTISNVLQT